MSQLDELLGELAKAAGPGAKARVGEVDLSDLIGEGIKLGGATLEGQYAKVTPEDIDNLKALGRKYTDSLVHLGVEIGDLVTSRGTGADKFEIGRAHV